MRASLLIVVVASLTCAEQQPNVNAARTVDTLVAADGCALRATAIAAGSAHACALMAGGTVDCWGANYRGQLGDGTTTFRSAPVQVVGLTDVVAIAAGARHTCALRREGTVWCWGANDVGQLGKPVTAGRFEPVPELSPEHEAKPVAVALPVRVKAIAAGSEHVLVLAENGDLYLWGQLRRFRGEGLEVFAPFKISLPPATRIAAGPHLDCAWTTDGRTHCWGPDLHWLGLETTNPFISFEVEEASALGPVAVGNGLLCGVGPGSSLRCSGEKQSVGNGGTRGEPSSPVRNVQVDGLSDVVRVASRWQTCAVIRDGRVACWGLNAFFEPGDGTEQQRFRPVWVNGVGDAADVAVGESSACITTRDGRIRCWGENGYGQLGNGTTETSFVPTEVRFCATNPVTVFPEAPPGVPLVAALQRTSCFGGCPIYSVRVYADGTVIYRGESNVRVRGGRKAQLVPADLDALRAAFRRAEFLTSRFECRFNRTDSASVRLFFADGDKARLIDHSHGCEETKPQLLALESEIERIVGSWRWAAVVVGGPSDFGAHEGPLIAPGVTYETDDDRRGIK